MNVVESSVACMLGYKQSTLHWLYAADCRETRTCADNLIQ